MLSVGSPRTTPPLARLVGTLTLRLCSVTWDPTRRYGGVLGAHHHHLSPANDLVALVGPRWGLKVTRAAIPCVLLGSGWPVTRCEQARVVCVVTGRFCGINLCALFPVGMYAGIVPSTMGEVFPLLLLLLIQPLAYSASCEQFSFIIVPKSASLTWDGGGQCRSTKHLATKTLFALSASCQPLCVCTCFCQCYHTASSPCFSL